MGRYNSVNIQFIPINLWKYLRLGFSIFDKLLTTSIKKALVNQCENIGFKIYSYMKHNILFIHLIYW